MKRMHPAACKRFVAFNSKMPEIVKVNSCDMQILSAKRRRKVERVGNQECGVMVEKTLNSVFGQS